MKLKAIYLLLTVLLFGAAEKAFAAFPVAAEPAVTSAHQIQTGVIVEQNAPHVVVMPAPKQTKATKTTVSVESILYGIIALAAGVIAVATGGVVAIVFGAVAIIFGVLGLKRPMWGLALAGLVLGIVGVILGLLDAA